MLKRIVLVDLNPLMIEAWKKEFEGDDRVEVVHGSIIDSGADVWVSPTNGKGRLSGGVDAVIKATLGAAVETALQKTIAASPHNGTLRIGRAVFVRNPKKGGAKGVVFTPTMVGESDNVSRTQNTALAGAAAFQAINMLGDGGVIDAESVALPGLGAGTGRVPVGTCAKLTRVYVKLFERGRFDSFDEMLDALNEELEGVGLAKAKLDRAALRKDGLYTEADEAEGDAVKASKDAQAETVDDLGPLPTTSAPSPWDPASEAKAKLPEDVVAESWLQAPA